MDQKETKNNAFKKSPSANYVLVPSSTYSIQHMSKNYVADSTDSSSNISSTMFKTHISNLTPQYRYNLQNVFLNVVSNIISQILLIFMFIFLNMQYWLKYEVLYATLMFWSCVLEVVAIVTTSTNSTI